MARYIDADKLNYSRVRIIHADGTAGGWNAVVMSSEIKNAPTADVAPRADVAREIFEEIEEVFRLHTEGGYYLNGVWFNERLDLDTADAIAELKKKYESEGADDEG